MRIADRRGFLGAGTAALIVLGAVTAPAFASEPVSVVATTGMIADITREIGGEAVSVKALMGPGVDPHAYRQTRTDIVSMAQADLVLWNGLYLEAQMEEFLAELEDRTKVVAVAEAVSPDNRVAHDDYQDRFDPHVWMDPELWKDVVLATRDALIDVSPENTDAFMASTDAYLAEVSAVGSYASDVLASVPENARVLISAHDAFNYFGEAYGFDVIGIQGISTESEAGLARIRDLVDLLVERDVRAVFVESSVSDRTRLDRRGGSPRP